MRFKGTAILFVLLALLAGWVYWTEIRGREERERAAEDAAKALPFDEADIAQISLVYPDRTITGARTDDGWRFVSPEGLEASAAEWDRLASNVGRVERGEVVVSEAPDLEAFGLASARLRVEVQTADGVEEEILFGAENPAGTDNYVKLASADEVFLSPTTWQSLLSVELDTLRDKTVLRFEQSEVDRIEISPGQVSLRREDGSWRLESPVRAVADDSAVRSFLSTLTSARATGFADESLSAAGLDAPTLQVTLGTGSGDAHVLRIGNQATEPDQYYARDDARDPVFVITSSIVDAASRSTFEWRDKTLASFDPDAVTRIEIESADSRLELNARDGSWDLAGQGAASSTRVSAMLDELEFARASDIIDAPDAPAAYGLDSPRVRVALETGGGERVRFSFGADAGEGDVYWKLENDDAVKVAPGSLLEEFSVTAEDLLEPEPAP